MCIVGPTSTCPLPDREHESRKPPETSPVVLSCHQGVSPGMNPSVQPSASSIRHVALDILDPCEIAFADAFEREGCDDGGADATAVLGLVQHNRVLGGSPVEDLAQRPGAALPEVWVLLEDGTVGTDAARLDSFLPADGRNAAGRESCGARPDELGQSSAELELGLRRLQLELFAEEFGCSVEILSGVPRAVGLESVSWPDLTENKMVCGRLRSRIVA